ncbi:MAG: M56 family metallopeptidase [Chitinophagaceae bacterium]|nr:M56 family metallopeptidase [Chitinophagaceae bacterium]
MGLLFIHIIKSSLCLIVFYFAYKLLVSKETFYKANRFILISIILFSVLIPFFQLTIHQPVVAAVPVQVTHLETLLLQQHMQVNVLAADGATIFYSLLCLVYLAGALSQLVITCINFIKVHRMTTRATRITCGDCVLALTDHEQSPFSWGKYIVLSKKEYASNPEIIIQHELIHIKKRHSLDLLLAELAVIAFWFNPVIWLLKTELKDTHEFEVDNTLLEMGVDAKQYQLLLIKKAVGEKVYSIANSFNQSRLSIRIRMMLRQRSNPWARLKYVCIFALTFFSVIVFARPEITAKVKNITTRNLGALLQTGGSRLIQNVSPAKTPPLQNAPRTAVIVKKPAPVAEPLSPVTVPSAPAPTQHSPLCFVDGKQTTYEEFMKINSARIKTVKVLKEEEAIKTYGEQGKNGAILVTLAANVSLSEPAAMPQMSTGANPIFVFLIDGKPVGEAEQAIFAKQVRTIINNPAITESVIMITGKEAIKRYGEKAVSGVMEIYLKKQ